MKERLYLAILEDGKVRCAIMEGETVQASETATRRVFAWSRLFVSDGKEADCEHLEGVAGCTPASPCEECHARAASWWRMTELYAAHEVRDDP